MKCYFMYESEYLSLFPIYNILKLCFLKIHSPFFYLCLQSLFVFFIYHRTARVLKQTDGTAKTNLSKSGLSPFLVLIFHLCLLRIWSFCLYILTSFCTSYCIIYCSILYFHAKILRKFFYNISNHVLWRVYIN